MKRQEVTLLVTVPDDASDPDIPVPEVLAASFDEAGSEYTVTLLSSTEVLQIQDHSSKEQP